MSFYSNKNLSNWSVAGLLVLAVLLILLGIFYPLILIWCLNTLFSSLSIPYSFWTWLAMTLLNIGLFGGIRWQLAKISNKL